jgi:hypothetical protein
MGQTVSDYVESVSDQDFIRPRSVTNLMHPLDRLRQALETSREQDVFDHTSPHPGREGEHVTGKAMYVPVELIRAVDNYLASITDEGQLEWDLARLAEIDARPSEHPPMPLA